MQHKALVDKVQEARAWQTRLRRDSVLRDLQGVDEADLEQPRLVALLRHQADETRRVYLARSVDAAEDQRSLDALEQTGLLPPSRDVDEVLRALQGRKVQAHAGVRYLVENHPAAAVLEQLAADPQRHAGVVVMRPADLALARALDPVELRLTMTVRLLPRDFDERCRAAVQLFWRSRTPGKKGARQGGSRDAVIGGKNMDGFIDLVGHVARHCGLPADAVHTGHKDIVLPGFYRPRPIRKRRRTTPNSATCNVSSTSSMRASPEGPIAAPAAR